MVRSGSGRSGSGSEIFDRLPDSGLHIGELGSGSDSDVYSQLDSLDRQKLGGPAVRRVNGDLSRERERHQHSQQGGRGRRGGRGGAAPPPPDCSPPPPPRPKLAGKEGRAGQDSPKSRGAPAFTRQHQHQSVSTFGKAASSALYKAESLSLEAVRGERGNHSSFFPEQGNNQPAPSLSASDHSHHSVLLRYSQALIGPAPTVLRSHWSRASQ